MMFFCEFYFLLGAVCQFQLSVWGPLWMGMENVVGMLAVNESCLFFGRATQGFPPTLWDENTWHAAVCGPQSVLLQVLRSVWTLDKKKKNEKNMYLGCLFGTWLAFRSTGGDCVWVEESQSHGRAASNIIVRVSPLGSVKYLNIWCINNFGRVLSPANLPFSVN